MPNRNAGSTRKPLIEAIQERVAVTAIGPSAVRGRGRKGVAVAARSYFATLTLSEFATDEDEAFRHALRRHTRALKNAFPASARHWGLARKCLNLFLRDAFYNHYLRKHVGLSKALNCFEIPLDSIVAKRLRGANRSLPRWTGLHKLTSRMSRTYQKAAKELAREMQIKRIHLDTYLWVEGRE